MIVTCTENLGQQRLAEAGATLTNSPAFLQSLLSQRLMLVPRLPALPVRPILRADIKFSFSIPNVTHLQFAPSRKYRGVPVHILLQVFGEVVVEDMGDVIYVQPAACHICCNQDSHLLYFTDGLMLGYGRHMVSTFQKVA